MSSAKLLISGLVQGVGFRYYTVSCAMDEDIRGWVRNLPDRRVEALVVGEKEQIEKLIEQLRIGPPGSRVAGIKIQWLEEDQDYNSFNIRKF